MRRYWHCAISVLALSLATGVYAAPTPQEVAEILHSVKSYADRGDTKNAIILMREWRNLRPDFAPTVEFQLQYAQLLFATGQDVEAAMVMRTLRGLPLTVDQKKLYAQLQLDETVFNANQLRQQGRLAAAYDTLAPVLAQAPDHGRALQSLGDMYIAANQPAAALDVYQQAQINSPNDASISLGAANAAFAAGDKNYAKTSLSRAVSSATDKGDIDVLQQAVQLYQRLGDSSQAAAVQRSIDSLRGQMALPAPTNPSAAVAATSGAGYINPFSHLEDTAGDRKVPLDAANYVAPLPRATESLAAVPISGTNTPPVKGLPPLQVAANRSPLPGNRLQQEYDTIMGERSAEIQATAHVSGRSGDSGTSRTVRVEEAVSAQIPAGDGAIKFSVVPTQVFAGSLDGTSYEGMTFGSGPEGALRQSRGEVGSPGSQRASGVGLSVAYLSKYIDADAGVTPIGFKYTDFTGGLKVKGAFDDAQTAQFYANLSRRPVVDSLLSFAGTRDSRAGLSWGGVSASGLKAGFTKDFDGTGIYLDLAWHHLGGHNVKSNQRTGFNLGMYHHFINEPDHMLTGGLNLQGMFYRRNLRYFTYGHGGYFSPQHYFALDFPVTWAQRGERYSYHVSGSLGLSQFRESAADMFPLGGHRQLNVANWIAASNRNDTRSIRHGVYPGQSKTAFNYSLDAAFEYRLTSQFTLGSSLSLNNSRDYTEWGGGFYFRYYFYPQKDVIRMPAHPQGPYYSQSASY